jgi:hypothetical protein
VTVCVLLTCACDPEAPGLLINRGLSQSLLQGNPQQALETDPALVDVINLTAIVIRRLIKMAKKINAFKNMCQEDQVALLKGGCTEIMLLRSAMNYDPTKQTWKVNELPWRVRVLMGFVADPAQPGDV